MQSPFTFTGEIDDVDEDPRCAHFRVDYEGDPLYDAATQIPVRDAAALKTFIRDCRQGIDSEVVLYAEEIRRVKSGYHDDGLQPLEISHSLWCQRGVLKIGLCAAAEDSGFVIPRSVHGDLLDFLERVSDV